MYKLTLTASERKAIDWIGGRYAHGTDLYKLLWGKCDQWPSDADWDNGGPIEFTIPEHVAWEIAEIVTLDDLACFAPALRHNLQSFAESIV